MSDETSIKAKIAANLNYQDFEYNPRYSEGMNVDNVYSCLGKTICSIDFKHQSSILQLNFTDNSNLTIADNPICCETRYFVIDDDLCGFIGASFIGIVVKPVQILNETTKETIEISFVDILTTKGDINITTHNDHNGCYAGINLTTKVNKGS